MVGLANCVKRANRERGIDPMWLNDIASDEKRQLLLPYVTRLTCADTPEIEREREVYIQSQMRYGRLSVERGVKTALLGPAAREDRFVRLQISSGSFGGGHCRLSDTSGLRSWVSDRLDRSNCPKAKAHTSTEQKAAIGL